MKNIQLILYNQLRKEYILDDCDSYIYIHHIGKINFLGNELKLNTNSKIIDYAGGKNLIDEIQLDSKDAKFIIANSFFSGLKKYCLDNSVSNVFVIKPVENYVYENFLKLQINLDSIGINLKFVEDNMSFFLSHNEFLKKYEKPPIMEYFYRFMRKKENIMIDIDGNPEGGKWNYDSMNRKFDKKHKRSWNLIFDKNKGLIDAENYYNHTLSLSQPTSRNESLLLLDYFIKNHLDNFGILEDAMYQNDPYVHHSMLSSSINYGFISPREVVNLVQSSSTEINNKEGFIRQVLGWREYIYHFFNYYKSSIYQNNFLGHINPLAKYFWKNGNQCSLNCVSTTLKQVQKENFSHHIQRLMIIGNYSLLCGFDPHELNKWFFEYYTDAFEWVVTPNVLGMSQYSDGGKLATKPYVASANYVNKMSDYCKNCKYDPKQKYGDTACPFNYLYWSFVDKNREVFRSGRQQFVLKNLEKVDIESLNKLSDKFKSDI